jgi:hypothetical protein
MGWDFGGENIFEGGNIGFWGQFKNYWSFSGGINRQGKQPVYQRPSGRAGPSVVGSVE